MGGTVLFVLKGYPRLSETFIAQEIRALEEAGLPIRIAALRRPTDASIHPVHREIAAPVSYLPEYLHEEPRRVLRGFGRALRQPGFWLALKVWLADLRREPTRNRVRRFGQALVLAGERPADVTHLHAHFIHTPASVVRYAALLTGLPWSVSAHAKDIWTSPDWDLAEKLHAAHWAVTCTRAGLDRLNALAPAQKPARLIYHGLDLNRFRPLSWPRPARDGSDAADPVRLLAVGRAVAKKGFDDLLDALAALPSGLNWRLTHIGGGEMLGALKAQAERLGLTARIDWRGAQAQEEVLAAYRAADLFVLPCRIASDGDRDGLPNVLMEAQSQGLCCLSSAVSGVPELIADGESGVLVPPGDRAALTTALARLVADPDLRKSLGKAGEARVRAQFSHRQGIAELAALFGLDTATAGPVRAAAE